MPRPGSLDETMMPIQRQPYADIISEQRIRQFATIGAGQFLPFAEDGEQGQHRFAMSRFAAKRNL